MKKGRHIMLASMSIYIAMFLPVQAFAMESGRVASDSTEDVISETPMPTCLGITPVYSASIQPEEKDIFVLTCKGTAGSELNIELNAFEYMDDTVTFEVEPDNYTVTDIGYKGSNEVITEEGYSVNNTFTVMDGEYADLTLAIGKEEGDLLNAMYSSTLSYAGGELVNWDSYHTRDNASDPTDGSVNDSQVNAAGNDADTADGEEVSDSETSEHPQTQSSAEKEAKVIYENPSDDGQSQAEPSGGQLALRVVPLIGIAIIAALVLFVLHKKGRI